MARVPIPHQGEFESWRKGLIEELRRVTFHYFPERIPPARVLSQAADVVRLETEPGIEVRLKNLRPPKAIRFQTECCSSFQLTLRATPVPWQVRSGFRL